jgi:hypothetical protein
MSVTSSSNRPPVTDTVAFVHLKVSAARKLLRRRFFLALAFGLALAVCEELSRVLVVVRVKGVSKLRAQSPANSNVVRGDPLFPIRWRKEHAATIRSRSIPFQEQQPQHQ